MATLAQIAGVHLNDRLLLVSLALLILLTAAPASSAATEKTVRIFPSRLIAGSLS
jgi:hypothetical protein